MMLSAFLPATLYAGDGTPLRSYLERGHCRNRMEVEQVLGKLGEATPTLKAKLRILMTRDSDPTVRMCAVNILAHLNDRPTHALAKLLDDDDERVREAAIYALSGAGEKAVEAVGEVLLANPCRHGSATAAAGVLWHLRSAAAAPYLAEVLREDTEGCAPREEVLRALESIRGPEGVRAMLDLLPYRHLTKDTYMALSKIWEPDLTSAVLGLLDDSSLAAEERMVYAMNFNEILGTRTSQGELVEFFEKVSGDSAVSPETRKAALVLSASFAAGGRDLFRAPLDERRARELAGNPQVRVEAKLISLGVPLSQSPAEAVPEGSPLQPLAELLLDRDGSVRAAAEEALVEAGSPAVVPVGEILRNAPCESEGAKAAVRVLGSIGDGSGAPYVAQVLLRNREGCFPLEVGLKALNDIGGTAAVRVLLTLVLFHEVSEGAYAALLEAERQELRGDMVALMNDSAEEPEMRMSYALTLNEIFGTWFVQEELVKFFRSLEQDPEMPAELRTTAGGLASAFAAVGLSTKPLDRETAGIRARELRRELKKFERESEGTPQSQAAVNAFLRTRYQLRKIGP